MKLFLRRTLVRSDTLWSFLSQLRADGDYINNLIFWQGDAVRLFLSYMQPYGDNANINLSRKIKVMNFEEKLKYGNQLIKEDNYLEAFDVFCELSYERQNDAEFLKTALYLFNQIVEGNYDFEPSTANEFLFRGVSKFYKNEFFGSNKDYDKALSLNPKLDIAYYNKGLNYAHLKKFELAIKEIEKAIFINPNGTYYNELAQQYYELEKFKECFQFHDKAIEKAPSNAFFWFTYGAHLSKGGLNANALLKLQKAVELDPKFEKAHQALEYVVLKLH